MRVRIPHVPIPLPRAVPACPCDGLAPLDPLSQQAPIPSTRRRWLVDPSGYFNHSSRAFKLQVRCAMCNTSDRALSRPTIARHPTLGTRAAVCPQNKHAPTCVLYHRNARGHHPGLCLPARFPSVLSTRCGSPSIGRGQEWRGSVCVATLMCLGCFCILEMGICVNTR